MSRGMVLIGAVSIWLWLSRTEMFWILCGSLVLLLALLADTRRIGLAHEIKTKGTSTTVGMRLAIAGYWVAVILALAWVISVLVWDTLRLDGRRAAVVAKIGALADCHAAMRRKYEHAASQGRFYVETRRRHRQRHRTDWRLHALAAATVRADVS